MPGAAAARQISAARRAADQRSMALLPPVFTWCAKGLLAQEQCAHDGGRFFCCSRIERLYEMVKRHRWLGNGGGGILLLSLL
ncbi:hypothetical protein KCP77_00595 [Salmonella enterica subsp. enterica]|nr:hypothetical protein KCP77_00595 [Salmonella enterica subsp. enterica]